MNEEILRQPISAGLVFLWYFSRSCVSTHGCVVLDDRRADAGPAHWWLQYPSGEYMSVMQPGWIPLQPAVSSCAASGGSGEQQIHFSRDLLRLIATHGQVGSLLILSLY